MTQPTIPEIPPLGITTAVLASELAAAGAAPDWIKITPRGPVTTRDGRALKLNFDPERLVERFKTDGVDVPADINHAIALRANAGDGGVQAIGWAKRLEARDSGTFARMEWLPSGKSAIAGRTYRYVSPSVFHAKESGADGFHEVTGLHSISLVPAPALSNMPALLSASTAEGATTVRAMLGLDVSADEGACVAALAALRAAFVPVELFSDVVAALNLSNNSQVALRAEIRKRDVEGFIEGALKAGKIVPAERSQYLALCSTDVGFEGIKALMASKASHGLFEPSGLGGRMPSGRREETATELAARGSRYREQQASLGIEMTQAEAIAFVDANPSAVR